MKNFKKILAVLLVLCMLPTIPLTAVAAGGDNTFVSLASADGANGVKVDGATYTLTKDIVVYATSAALTNVTIDGAGYTITTTAPLFADLSGTVMNLKIEGKVNDESTKFIGVLANQVTVGALTLSNVTNNATLTTNTVADGAGVGGFIGKSTQKVAFNNCANNGNVTADAESVNGGHRGYLGGFIGQADAATEFKACVNKGDIKGNTFAGGFIGYASKADAAQTLENCANIGNISAKHTRTQNQWLAACLAGGFIAGANQVSINISSCYNTGNISAESGQSGLKAFASGFLSVSGVVYKTASIQNSYSAGTQTVSVVEGGVGYASSVMGEYSYNKAWDSNKIASCQKSVYVKADGSDPFSSVDSRGFVLILADYDADKKYTSEELANGILMGKLNTALGKNGFGQRVGKDANPWLWTEYANKSIAEYWTKNDTTYTLDASEDIIVGLTYANKFTGTLDGNNATIYTVVPLFAEVAATIQNLTIEGDIVDSTTSGGTGVAALTKTVTGETTLKNVTNNANVTSTVASPNQLAIGGLIGLAKQNNLKLTLENCANNGTVSAVGSTSGGGSGRVYVGGLIGMTSGSDNNSTGGTAYLSQCVNNGNVSSNSVSGGLVGRTATPSGDTIRIEQCVNAGNITTANDGKMSAVYNYCCAGGFVGLNANKRIKITDSFNIGDVSAIATGTNTSASKATAAGLCNFYEIDKNILPGDSAISGNYSIGNVAATAPSGEATYVGLLISEHYKGGIWNATKAAFIGTNYVLAVDSAKNGQDVFNTYNGADSTESEVIKNAVMNVKSVDFKMTQEASIRLYSKDETGIRFNSSVNKDAITAIENAFAETYGDSFEIGTMLWITTDQVTEYTHAVLNAAGVAFTEAKRTSSFNDNELDKNDNTKYIIRGSLVDIAAENSNVYISARAYVKIGDHYIYADGVSTTCIKDIADIAYNDETADYSEEIMSWLENYGATKKEVTA